MDTLNMFLEPVEIDCIGSGIVISYRKGASKGPLKGFQWDW